MTKFAWSVPEVLDGGAATYLGGFLLKNVGPLPTKFTKLLVGTVLQDHAIQN